MLDRSSAPSFSKTFTFELPEPKVIRLTGGLDLIFLSEVPQDVFKLEIIFDAGKWWETKRGVSHFTALTLDKGTTNRDAKAIAEYFDYHGSQIEISPSYDFVSASLYGLNKHFDKVFPIFWDVITAPVFPLEEFQLQREIFVENLKVNNEKNSFVASKLLRKNVFGTDHPYGSSVEEADALDLSTQDLVHFFSQRFSPSEVYLTGHFDKQQIQILTDRFTSTKKGHSEKQFAPIPSSLREEITKEESVQSSIRLGKRFVGRTHPDYFELLLLNHILGGYFGSRLMKNIREEKGLTYGIYSSINAFKNDCLFSIGADVGKEKKELALTEIKRELSRLIEQPIEAGELSAAKNHFLGSLQLEVANPFACTDKIKNIRLNNLSETFYKNLFAKIQASNPDTLQALASRYLVPNDLQIVCVG
ncbi:MAG TPA: pitrilysin family protein [Cyclobacteriaceae bacterium]|jgi:predicted Zn-dependent peptidase|nr:pitrilysin family protein [Cyclobacteriaceae bacterium]